MLKIARGVFICFSLILLFRSTGAWTTTTPAIKIIPESDGNFFYYSNLYGPKGAQHYINSIKRFLNTYDEREYEENIRYCDFNHPRPENRVCAFDIRNLGACSQLNDFGYSRGRPCFYFTLSQVLDWVPVVLNVSDIQLHSDPFLNIPNHLNSTISFAESEKSVEKYVWLTCDGDTGADKEYLGPVSYYPHKGFPTYYFPFTNVPGYQSPIVAVQFERPKNGVDIFIECKAWARNIQLDREKEIGYVKFQLLID